MGQHKIEKAYFDLLGGAITVYKFDHFVTTHPHLHSFKGLRCLECTDPIVFVKHKDGTYYFAHSMHGDGHEYCPLYTGHKEPPLEFLLKKAFSQDIDIGLVFNMIYENGKWGAAVMIPPFSQNAISDHEKNQTTISVSYDNVLSPVVFPVNFEQFSPGEMRRIDLPTIPKRIHIRFSGKASAGKDNRLELEGFAADKMLFRTPIPDMFTETAHGLGSADLRSKKRIALRRVSHVVYTEKPYVFFGRGDKKIQSTFGKEQAEITKLLLKKDESLNYDIYQIVFHKVDPGTISFCEGRGCLLEERSDAVVLWPPVTISGENHFVGVHSSDVFFSLENDKKVFDLKIVKTPRDFLKISNDNAEPFYLMRQDKRDSKKPCGRPTGEIKSELDCSQGNFYRFMDGALLGPETEKKHKLIPGESILHIASRLAPKTYSLGQRKKSPIAAILKDAIESPSDYVLFSKSQHERLKKRYSDDLYVMDYLDYCLYQNEINEAALRVLIGGI